MQEYFSDAIVLDRLANGDLDSRIVLFTKKFGKLVARAKSARKITSKLSAHLEPGNLIQVRLIEKNGLQIADALKKAGLGQKPADFYFLGQLLAEAEPELHIWEMLVHSHTKREMVSGTLPADDSCSGAGAGGMFFWREVLKILGWDPDFAACAACSNPISAFHIKAQEFFCGSCAFKLPKDEVIYV